MSPQMTEEQIYEEARKRVEEKRGFFIHLAIYVVVNIFLAAIWWFTGAGFPWFVFPLGGWAIGIIMHFLSVFVFNRLPDQAAIEKEAEKLRRRQG
jgi:hypothetical protein